MEQSCEIVTGNWRENLRNLKADSGQELKDGGFFFIYRRDRSKIAPVISGYFMEATRMRFSITMDGAPDECLKVIRTDSSEPIEGEA